MVNVLYSGVNKLPVGLGESNYLVLDDAPKIQLGCLPKVTPASLSALGAPSGLDHPTLTVQQTSGIPCC